MASQDFSPPRAPTVSCGDQGITLGGYAAKQCPVRTHNDFSPTVPTPERETAPELQADFDAGIAFEAEIFAELRRIHPDAVLIGPELRRHRAVAATLEAIDAGAPLILGGWLPDDSAGGRKGKPDILVRIDGGYLPADVKNHMTIAPAGPKSTATVASLDRPDNWFAVEELKPEKHRYDDGIQLAHYTRMLQTMGIHPGNDLLRGAIIGTSLLKPDGVDPGPVFVWYDLTEPVRTTFSRRNGRVRRSLLECYDYEHQLRLTVASAALNSTGSIDDPEPLVVPVGQKECVECPYVDWCASQMGPEDASLAITRGRLDSREWRTLRRMGFGTVTALADLDPESLEFLNAYHPEVSHRSRDSARKRLIGVVRQAGMIRDDVAIAPIGNGPVEVPAADIEIDFDLEWDTDGRIYQWGLRIRDGQDESTARYEPAVSFARLDDEEENRLAGQVASRISGLREHAASTGRSLAVYHWSHPEVSMTKRFDNVAAALDGVTVDLLDWLTANFHVRGGAGIKDIAPLFGFAWAVEGPGGRASQEKIEITRAGGDDARDAQQWCLRYNESDVAAQAAIRDGLRAMFPLIS